MTTIKSYTSLAQSKKLAEILPLESADMTCIGTEFIPYPYCESKFKGEDNVYPAWSLAALLSIFPEIQGGKPIIALDDNYITYPHINDLHTKAGNLVDACVNIIIKLHELNLLLL